MRMAAASTSIDPNFTNKVNELENLFRTSSVGTKQRSTTAHTNSTANLREALDKISVSGQKPNLSQPSSHANPLSRNPIVIVSPNTDKFTTLLSNKIYEMGKRPETGDTFECMGRKKSSVSINEDPYNGTFFCKKGDKTVKLPEGMFDNGILKQKGYIETLEGYPIWTYDIPKRLATGRFEIRAKQSAPGQEPIHPNRNRTIGSIPISNRISRHISRRRHQHYNEHRTRRESHSRSRSPSHDMSNGGSRKTKRSKRSTRRR